MIHTPRFLFLMLTLAVVAIGSARAIGDERPPMQAWAAQSLLGTAVPDAPQSVLDASRPPFSFTYDGKASRNFLASWNRTITEAPAVDGRRKHTITYTDPASGLEVVCEATLFTDFPAVEWVLHFHNPGNVDTPILENIRPLDLDIASPADAPVVLHHSKGSQCEPTDFLPIDEPVAVNTEINLAPNGGRSSDGVLPFFNLQWNGGGLVGAIGWSGQWALRLHREVNGSLLLQGGQQVTHFKLHPAESVRTPRILLTLWQGDEWLRGNNLFRRLLIAHYLPKRDSEVAVAPVAWLSWFAFNSGNDVNEENQLEWIARTAEAGAECYWLDAGWFEGGWPNGAGSWVPGAKQFPRGLQPLGDAAHQKGMKFVLWFEPERVAATSRTAKEHPQWVLHTDVKVGFVMNPTDGLFNLGDPAARAWLTDHLSKCFGDWGVDVFRNDFNIDPLRFWLAADAPDRQGISEIRYVEGLYQLWDELVERRPGLTIDNCASGGRRIDLETLSRSYPLWRSDYPCNGQANSAADQVETAGLSLYVPQHSAGVWAFDPYRFRSVATMGASLCPDLRNKDLPLDVIKLAIGEVKELRPLYFGDYYPLLVINDREQAWSGWQFDRPELGRGFAMLFRRSQSPDVGVDVCLRGLDAAATYEVEFRETYETKEKRTLTGAELARLHVEIVSAPGSLLILYHKAD